MKFTPDEKREIVFNKKQYPTLYALLQKRNKWQKKLKGETEHAT